MVTANVVDLGLLDERPNLGLLKMVKLVFIGGSKVGDHAAVVAGDDNTAFSSRLSLINTVFGVDAGSLAGVF